MDNLCLNCASLDSESLDQVSWDNTTPYLERYEHGDKEKRKSKSILEWRSENKKTKKQLTFSESESDESMERNDILLPMKESTEEEVKQSDDDKKENNSEDFLLNLLKSLSPLMEESDIKSKWYAFIFKQHKKKYLHLGRIIQSFLVDETGKIEYLQIDCFADWLLNLDYFLKMFLWLTLNMFALVGVFSLHLIVLSPYIFWAKHTCS